MLCFKTSNQKKESDFHCYDGLWYKNGKQVLDDFTSHSVAALWQGKARSLAEHLDELENHNAFAFIADVNGNL